MKELPAQIRGPLHEIEMNAVAVGPRDFDELSISVNEDDELDRKSRLLSQRMEILQNTNVEIWNEIYPVFNIIAILSISGMQFGYSIIQITAVMNARGLLSDYGLDSMPIGLGVGLLVALMPMGAVMGGCIGRRIRGCFGLKAAHHVVNCLTILACGVLMQITTLGTVVSGRLLYGVSVACYCSWSTRYIQDLSPPNLKLFTRSIYSIWVIGAIMLGYFLGLMLHKDSVSGAHHYLFAIPAGLALLQMILMLLFVPESPGELFRKQYYEEGRAVLEQIYKEDFVDMMLDRFKLQIEVEVLREEQGRDERNTGEGRCKARLMGLYLNVYREFIGITTVLVYSGYFITPNDSKLGEYTNLIVTLISFVGTVVAHVFLAHRCSRKALMLLSTLVFSLCSFGIMAGMLTHHNVVIFVFLVVFMGAFGVTYSIVSTIYPSEILGNERVPYSSFTAWPAMIMATLVPPVVGDVIVPGHLPWPMFLAFGVFGLISILYLWFCSVESRGRNYDDIVRDFQ